MPDDERTRRRLGDATKSRIADLASGWSVEAPAAADTEPDVSNASAPETAEPTPAVTAPPSPPVPAAPRPHSASAALKALAAARASAAASGAPPAAATAGAGPDAPPSRPKPRTNPPPPPGSAERRALEERIIATRSRDDDPTQPGGDPAAAARPSDEVIELTRPKRPTVPPLPPSTRASGSVPIPAAAARSKPTSVPPPIPASATGPTRAPSPTQPPSASGPARAPSASAEDTNDDRAPARSPRAPTSGPKYPRATYAGPVSPLATVDRAAPAAHVNVEAPFAREAHTPAVILDSVADLVVEPVVGNAPPPTAGELVVKPAPRSSRGAAADHGFDSGVVTVERAPGDATVPVDEVDLDEISDAGAEDNADTIDVAMAAVGSSDRGDPTTNDPLTEKFERGDPTQATAPGAAADATDVRPPGRTKQLTTGTLRSSSALRRKRGLYGDVRYVFTALLGVRRGRRELSENERRQELRTTSRRRHLITLGRAAATMDSIDHPALGKARDRLSEIEDERAKHTGAVAASDAELERVRREREANTKAHAELIAKAGTELVEITKKLEPLEKEAAAARKRGADLRDELQRIDKKIADAEALVVSVKGEKLDKAALAADIATLRANKQAVLRDEPAIAAQLDALNPRIAALDAQRVELAKKKTDAEKADADDQKRTTELLDAIGAKRKVVERAAADAETARDNALFELGERLYVDRPAHLAAQLNPIDRIDLEIGEDERRAMELREILSNVDQWKLARGSAMIVLVVGIVAAIAYVIWTNR